MFKAELEKIIGFGVHYLISSQSSVSFLTVSFAQPQSTKLIFHDSQTYFVMTCDKVQKGVYSLVENKYINKYYLICEHISYIKILPASKVKTYL